MEPKRIPPRDRDAILQALRAGVVPRRGLHLIQVGRRAELNAATGDVERIVDGGAAFRVVVGDYGAGKTFLLSVMRAVAMEKNLVALSADFTPDRRLQGSGGQAVGLYQELMRNTATRTKPDGGALGAVVERFATSALQQAKASGENVEAIIDTRLHALSQAVGGFDFANVIQAYWRGHEQGNEQLKQDSLRWLRGEFATKTEARQALGVRVIVDDDAVYEHLKLFASFCRLAGYAGLHVTLDEAVNLLRIPNAQARQANYERLLAILNDVLQGSAEGLGFVLGSTPEALMDPRRGLYSYAALQSRLAENSFASQQGLVDYSGPVIRLAPLEEEDLYVLLTNLRQVQAGGDPARHLVPDEALHAFLAHCSNRIGAAYFQTPRATVRAFLDLLAVLEQHPHLNWRDLIGEIQLAPDEGDAPLEEDASAPPAAAAGSPAPKPDDDLASFRL